MNENQTSTFLLKEYDRISEAHFNTSNQISLFFRYYLTLMSVPAFLLLFINKDVTVIESLFKENSMFFLRPHLGWLCIIISVIGMLLTVFLTKLKFEHILYARTVNGIRNYFIHQDPNLKSFLVLPTNTKKPSFTGLGYLSLIIVNALVNSAYMSLGMYFINVKCFLVFGAFLIIAHIMGYYILSPIEERKTASLQ